MTSSRRYSVVLPGFLLGVALEVGDAESSHQDAAGEIGRTEPTGRSLPDADDASPAEPTTPDPQKIAPWNLGSIDLKLPESGELALQGPSPEGSEFDESGRMPGAQTPTRFEENARPVVFPPRWNGNTLFATGAFTAAVGLVLHAASARGFSDKCRVVDSPEDLLPSRLQDLGIGNIAEATFLDEIDLLCRPTVVLPGAGRALVPVVAAGAIAQIGAGGAFRGYKLGYEDAFFTGRRRSAVMRMGVGGTLMTIGAILWAASRGALYQNNTGCTDIDCVVWFDFGTFQASSILFMAGTGLVTEGMALKRSRQLYDDWKSFDVRPMLSGRRVGVAVSGRF